MGYNAYMFKLEKKNINIRLIIFLMATVVVLTPLTLVGLYFRYLNFLKLQVVREVTIESGSPILLTDFFTDKAPNISLISDISGINTSVPATYNLQVKTGDYHVETVEDVVLNIVDTTPPTGKAIPQLIYWDEVPEATSVVTDVYDLSHVTVEYLNPMERVILCGEYDVPVKLTDAYGNVTIVDVPFEVIYDRTPPEIEGARNLECFIGDIILYRDGVRVTDNYDTTPTLEIDTSEVNMNEVGLYPVTYKATDEHGNTSTVTIKVNMREMPERYYDPEELYALARDIIEEENICDPSMSDLEITLRIFDWVSRNMWYISSSDRVDWTAGAYDGLTTRRGDCYNFMAVARAMLGAMGIESITIDRYPEVPSPHFWNLVNIDGKWYHCDACVFLNMTDITFYCCRIDSELRQGHSSYDPATLPEGVVVATESIQDKIDYEHLTVK